MNKETYLSHNEYMSVLRLMLCVQEAGKIAEECKDTAWKRKLKCATTYMHNIFSERIKLLDPKARATLMRRLKGTKIDIKSADLKRISNVVNGGDDLLEITVNLGALYDLAALALNSCSACPQGKEWVEKCYYRKVMHALDIPVQRTCVAEGQCEYKTDNEVKQVNPKCERMDILDDMVLERYEEI